MPPVFEEELAAADAFARSFPFAGLGGKPTRRLAILTCMDTRIDPMRIFGLEPGEAVILRDAGARIDEAVRRAVVVARDQLDVDRLLVLGHTDCRGTADAARTVRDDVEALDVDGIAVGGFVYDVATGRVTAVTSPPAG